MIMKKLLIPVLAALMLCACGSEEISQPESLGIYSKTETISETTTTAAETTTETEKITTAETAETVTTAEQTEPTETETEAPPEEQPEEKTESKAEELLGQMSVREKVGQLFMIRPDGLLYDDYNDHGVREVGDELRQKLKDFPVGGLIMFASNIKTPEQITQLNRDLQSASRIPLFITTDEEGGYVARIALNDNFDVQQFPTMLEIAASGDTAEAYNVGKTIGSYMSEYGFDLDLAPVADVNTNPLNIVIGARAFGSDPETAAEYVSACVDGFHDSGVMTCLKHFPGHGDTFGDTHKGTVYVDKNWDELKDCELIPFIENLGKTDMIMAAHISLPNITGEDTPASLSKEILTDKLRGELGYDGVIITDALAMDAVKNVYSSEDAALEAFNAGADILLIPERPFEAYEAIAAAVENGDISEERLDESVLRILKLKEKYGMLG